MTITVERREERGRKKAFNFYPRARSVKKRIEES